MWSWALVCGLFPDNVVLLSVNVVLRVVLFAVNVVQKRILFVVQGVYVCGPLQLPVLIVSTQSKRFFSLDKKIPPEGGMEGKIAPGALIAIGPHTIEDGAYVWRDIIFLVQGKASQPVHPFQDALRQIFYLRCPFSSSLLSL